MWAVQNAKAKLSEILRRAKAGEPQVIGSAEPCVVLSMDEYRRLTERDRPHLGRWLLDNIPRGLEIELPSREDTRPDPFENERPAK
jgi:prevent-host-death family protein